MKRYLLIWLLCLLTLTMATGLVACEPKDEPEEELTDEEASLVKLCESMLIDEDEARALLALLAELEVEGRVMFAYPAEDSEDRIYYHVWIGEGTVDIYLDEEGGVAAISRAGSLIYGELPASPEEDEGDEPGDLPEEDIGIPSLTSVTIDSYSATVRPGAEGYVYAKGLAGVAYTIKVYYASGASTSKDLQPQTAAENGSLSWEWDVSANVKPGQYKIVIARSDDSRDAITLPFEVLGETAQ